MRKRGLPVEYAFSIRGIWLQFRARVVVFSHSVEHEFFAPLIANRVKRVQTWHGMPIKKIGYDDHRGWMPPDLRAYIIKTIFPFRSDHFDLVLAGSQSDKKKYERAFNVKEKSVVITGYPRNDALIKSFSQLSPTPRAKRKVIYMPTFRGVPESEFSLFFETRFNFLEADNILDRLKMELWIKLHPIQIFAPNDIESINRCKNVHLYSEDEDIYESIGFFDVLITDFSGIYFDYLLSGKPIIMAPLNKKSYLENDRNLYYSYDQLCPSNPCNTWNEVFTQLSDLVKYDNFYNEKYFNLQKKFHSYLDANSSERAYYAIQKILV
jgi:CDP-glycerol glycerophosphotransferase (TagB/SpsB family)